MSTIKQGLAEFRAAHAAMEARIAECIAAEASAFYEATGVHMAGVGVRVSNMPRSVASGFTAEDYAADPPAIKVSVATRSVVKA